jgi:histidinol dehydrogenase
VLPTAGAARYVSGLGTDDFQKRISVAEASRAGVTRAAPRVAAMARAEAFEQHALSVEARAPARERKTSGRSARRTSRR